MDTKKKIITAAIAIVLLSIFIGLYYYLYLHNKEIIYHLIIPSEIFF